MGSPTNPRTRAGKASTFLIIALIAVVLLAAGTIAYKKLGAKNLTPTATTQDAPTFITLATPADRTVGGGWLPPVFPQRIKERTEMVNLINTYYQLEDKPTLDALSTVPRHEFVPDAITSQAYEDSPLPIANGQLISQPWIVGCMTMNLHLKPDAKVLEVGTGSGYQAAVLTHLTPNVYSIEIIKPLAEAAAARLKRLGYNCLSLRVADGFYGWPEAAPFDAIIVTCAAGQIPPPLLQQLKPGGHMMIPVGQPFATQNLILVDKDVDGTIHSKDLGIVRFVPLLQKDPTAGK